MNFVYLVSCVYRDPDHRQRGSFTNLAFETKSEAIDYCDYHTDEFTFWCWVKITIGSFEKPKTKK